MPKVSQAHTESRRQQILEAAFRCLSRKGFRETTMRDICEEAGLSLGGVYGHFSSKEDLIRTLATLGREQTRTFLESVSRDSETPAAAAGHLLDALIANLDSKECKEAIRTDVGLWGESLHAPELRKLVVQAFRNTMAPFVDEVRRGQERGAIRRDLSAEAAGRVFLALFQGLAVQKAVDRETDTQACARVMAALLDGSFEVSKKKSKRK